MIIEKRMEILEAQFEEPKITLATIDDMKTLSSSSFYRGHVRTARGEVYLDGEFEKRSNAVLKVKLP